MRSYLLASLVSICLAMPALAQSPVAQPPAPQPPPAEVPEISADPTLPSPQIREKIGEIRRAEEIERLERELVQLRQETDSLRQENEGLRRQLLQKSAVLPPIVMQGRIVGGLKTLVILEIGGQPHLVRPGIEILVPLGQNQATPLLVKEVSPENVELVFTALDRTIVLSE